MLGEQIGHETGQITGTRVLPGDGSAVQVEVSFQASGTLLGIAAVFEYDTDETGKSEDKTFEWK